MFDRIIFVATSTLIFAGLTQSATAGDERDIRLVLQITVDGLRADLLNRYANDFGIGGFKYLMHNGTVYSNAHNQHAHTETIVGHTTLATGTFPSQHGMVGNVIYDRQAGELSYNIVDEDAPLLPSREQSSTGDIYLIQDPYWFLLEEGLISVMYGSPWRYDTHVPVIFSGPGIKPQQIQRIVHPVDVAPTIAKLLGMTAPASTQGTLLTEVINR
jgi:predicted AlkP superfamily pyrophosphatase or phosphodiesterase